MNDLKRENKLKENLTDSEKASDREKKPMPSNFF